MDFAECEYVPLKKIYTLHNTITNTHYLFVGKYNETDSIINKLINEDSLLLNDNLLLNKYYGKNVIQSKLKYKNLIFIKTFINVDDTILIIKKKITKYIYNDIEPNKQHLWITKNKLTKDNYLSILNRSEINLKYLDNNINFNNFSYFLGIEYKNNAGIKLFPMNITDYSESDLPEFDDNLYDLHSVILEEYGSIEDNIIYINTLNDIPDNLSNDIYKLYFPFNKEENEILEHFNDIIEMKHNQEIKYENSAFSLKEYKDTSCKLENIVFRSNIQNININGTNVEEIDLNYIFNTIKLTETIRYVKYKNEFYKFFTQKQRNNITMLGRDFKNPEKYIINYEKKFYEPIISQNTLIDWTKKTLSFREKQYIKEQKYFNLNFMEKNNNDLVFKIHYNDEYFEFILNEIGICYIRLFFKNTIDNNNIKEIISLCNGLIKKINNISNYKLQYIGKNNINYITLDSSYTLDIPTTKISKIKKVLNNFVTYSYSIVSDADTLLLKYTKVNTYNTYINYKNLFLKLKKAPTKSLSVSEFRKLWIKESKNIFSLSEIESIKILSQILEEYSKQELKRTDIEYEVTILIQKNYYNKEIEKDNFTIKISNCYNLKQLARIKEFVGVLLAESIKKIIVIKADKKEEVKMLEVKQTTFTNADNFDLDDDFLDFEDDDEDEENESANELDQEEDLNVDELNDEREDLQTMESEDADDKPGVMKKRSIRNYMAQMRKIDTKLFKYKTVGNDSYSIKCGAVDMRQPIILSKTELDAFERKNLEGFNLLQKLEWGSSEQSKNFYICPRIWCIRCKIALTDNQLIKNNGKCPFCQGEIIDSQDKEIMENKTIIIRRAGSNKYWSNPSKIKTKAWKKYLYETEKDAHPGFLDPKLHPNGFCMPCCNANKHWNYSKCFIVPIDFMKVTTTPIKIGDKIGNYTVKENNTILFLNDNIYQIKKTGMIILKELTKIKLPLQEGMTIHITEEPKNKYYKVVNRNGTYKFIQQQDKVKILEERYIIGEDKFPLPVDKIGFLPKNIDIMFSNNTLEKVNKNKLKNMIDLFVRRGVPQVQYNSFLCCLAYLKEMSLNQLVSSIIINLEPQEFMSLNSGDIFKMFVSYDKELEQKDESSFKNWCKMYKTFSQKTKRKLLVKVYYSFENYKKYCADMNVRKDPIFFLDLLSKKNDWYFKNGLNIIILERKMFGSQERLYLKVPQVDSVKTLYNDYQSTCILYKYRGLYEPIIYARTLKNITIPYFFNYFNINKTINDNALQRIRNLVKIVTHYAEPVYDTSINFSKLMDVRSVINNYKEYKPTYYVHDEYSKGVGILLENNTILFTLPFPVNRYKILKKIELEKVPLIGGELLKQNLDKMDQKYGNYVLDNGNINGLILENGMIHPIKEEVLKDNMNYEELQRVSNNLTDYNNVLTKFNDFNHLYNNFKHEISNVFQKKSKNIVLFKKIVYAYISNYVIPLDEKRHKLLQIFNTLAKNVIKEKATNHIKSKKQCYQLKRNECNKSKKCSYDIKNSFTLEIGKEKIIFNFSKCKMVLNKDLLVLFINKLVEELIFSIKVRIEILEGKLKNEIEINEEIFNKNNLETEIKKYYKGSNFYLVNNVVNIMPYLYLTDELIKEVSNTSELIVDKNEIYARTITDGGINMNLVTDVKAGKCIFPFKIDNAGKVEIHSQCINHQNPLHGKYCATEIDDEGFLKKYAFCPKQKGDSNTALSVIASSGPKKVKDTSVKPKPVIASSGPKKVKDTSVKPKPVITSSGPKLVLQTVGPKKVKIMTQKGKECIIPFKIGKTEYNVCKEGVGGRKWCVTEMNSKGKMAKDGWDYCKETPDLTGWEGPIENKFLWSKKNNVIKTKVIYTLSKAIETSKQFPECKGITYNKSTNKYTLRGSTKLYDGDGFKTWLKK